MNKSSVVELLLIALSITVFAVSASKFPNVVNLGWLIVYFALTLLIQGFFRDIYLLYKQKTQPENKAPIAMRCMCLESSIGLPAVFIGISLAYGFSNWNITLSSLWWTMIFSIALLIGFSIKDLIIIWRPFAIRKEENHANIIFKW